MFGKTKGNRTHSDVQAYEEGAFMLHDDDLGAVSGGISQGGSEKCPQCGQPLLFSGDPNGSWLKRCMACGYTWNSFQEEEKNASTPSTSGDASFWYDLAGRL